MPSMPEGDRLAEMIAPERGEEARQLALALISRAMEVVETLPVDGRDTLHPPVTSLQIAHSAIAAIPLTRARPAGSKP